MADRTGIEWTDATWNPMTGCTKVSSGCDHCYAETFAERFRGTPGHYFEHGFDVVLRPDKLELPLRWSRPRRIFVNSMSDLFHDAVPDEYIAQVFEVMARAPQHTFQVLTKRHARMRSLLSRPSFRDNLAHWGAGWPLPNVWVGVSVENQQWADIRIPALLETPAAVRWVSAEPLLGPLDLSRWLGIERYDSFGWGQEMFAALNGRVGPRGGLHWVVTGGESGRGARPMHPAWARDLRDQCAAADVPFLFKQWGEHAVHAYRVDPWWHREADLWVDTEGQTADEAAALAAGGSWHGVWRVGKKASGRELDGRTHDGYPVVPA